MLIPGSSYWNMAHGAAQGEAAGDAEGLQIMRVLGKNMAWLLKSMSDSKSKDIEPAPEAKVMTNFIR